MPIIGSAVKNFLVYSQIARGLAHSKTLARLPRGLACAKCPGVRRPSAAPDAPNASLLPNFYRHDTHVFSSVFICVHLW